MDTQIWTWAAEQALPKHSYTETDNEPVTEAAKRNKFFAAAPDKLDKVLDLAKKNLASAKEDERITNEFLRISEENKIIGEAATEIQRLGELVLCGAAKIQSQVTDLNALDHQLAERLQDLKEQVPKNVCTTRIYTLFAMHLLLKGTQECLLGLQGQ